MKKFFTLFAACSFAVMGAYAETTISEEASSEPASVQIAAAAAAAPAAPAAVKAVEVPQLISEHLALRFPGRQVQNIEMQGVTYYVDLGKGDHVRYDADFNPICYGDHSHECRHEGSHAHK